MRKGGIHQKNLLNRTGEMATSHLIPRRGQGVGLQPDGTGDRGTPDTLLEEGQRT